jgi:membrane protease YdiL (CAAX protease family)
MRDAPPPDAAPARTAFLWALGGILALCVAPVAQWMAYVRQPRGPSVTPAQRLWTRRLGALCVLDTLLATLLFMALPKAGAPRASGPEAAQGTRAVQGQRSVIGVSVAPAPVEGAVRVAQVRPGSAAERAGLQDGDAVLSCDGAATPTREALIACISAHPPGAQVTLEVRRDSQVERVQVDTEPAGTLPPPGRLPWEPLVASVLLLVLAWVGLVRARAWEPLAAVGVLLGASALTALLWTALEPYLVGTWRLLPLSFLGVGLLLGVSLVRRVSRTSTPALWSAGPGWLRFLGLALWVHLTGLLRVAALLGFTLLVTGAPSRLEPIPLEGIVSAEAKSAGAVALFLLITVVLAPLAEELLFRGLVLEGFLRWMRPAAAVVATAAIFALMHAGYGLGALLVFFIGCVLGWARLGSGGLRVPILIHAAQNLAGSVALLLTRS